MANVNLNAVFLYAKSVCRQCHSQPKNLGVHKFFLGGKKFGGCKILNS